MVKFIKGDLVKQCNEFSVIIHGCNCFHTMGAGIARTISDTWPGALEADKLSPYGSMEKLGDFTSLELENPTNKKRLKIINAYTQHNWSRKTSTNYAPPVDYEAIQQVMESLKIRETGKEIGIPLIGAGLAGGNWDLILEIIKKELEDEDVTIIEFDENYSGKDYSKDYTEIISMEYVQRTY